MRSHHVLIALLVWSAASTGHAAERVPMSETVTLIDFGSEVPATWSVINDGVMGGRSRSDIQRTEAGTSLFAGTLSLENNGGFASIRSALGRFDLSRADGLELRVKGDGRTYQVRLRDDDRYDGIAHRAEFETVADTWITIPIPFTAFAPTFRGRILDNVPPLDTAGIRQLAFMLADKTPGEFRLEIAVVRSWTEAP